MKKIVVVVAMDKELATLVAYLTNVKKLIIRNKDVYFGTLDNHEVIVAKTGIGKVAAASFLTLLIERYNPDMVFNIGIAGAYSKLLKTQDTLVVTKAYYSDVDMTTDAFTNLRYGQLQDLPLTFKTCEKVLREIKNLKLSNNLYFGTIMTGDQFVTSYDNTDKIVSKYFNDLNVLACDMESCAVGHVCYLTNTKFIIVRSISDLIGSSDAFDYQTFAPIAANNATLLVNYIIKELEL